MTIDNAQQKVDEWIKTIGVRYFDELTNTVVLMEEVGELARIAARKFGEQSSKVGEELTHEKWADELADILWVVISLANQTGVNLTEAFEKNIKKKSTRDAMRSKNNPKL